MTKEGAEEKEVSDAERGGTVGDLFLRTRAGRWRGGGGPSPPTSARRARRPHAREWRSVRSSETCTRRGRLVGSRGLALRHPWEGDEQDIWDRARVDDLIHF